MTLNVLLRLSSEKWDGFHFSLTTTDSELYIMLQMWFLCLLLPMNKYNFCSRKAKTWRFVPLGKCVMFDLVEEGACQSHKPLLNLYATVCSKT